MGWVVMGISIYLSFFWLSVYIANREHMEDYPVPDRERSISILIPAYNEEEWIGDCIESCLSLDYPDDLVEIIVVDDGSTDGTADIARTYADEHERVSVHSQENQGKGGALNTALEQASHELILVLDADSKIEPDAPRKMVGYFADENVAGVIASIKPLEARTVVQQLQKVEYMIGMLYRKLMSRINTLYVTPGALSLYRREPVAASGGFDEDNLTEDLEIALRLRSQGYDLAMSLTAVSRTEMPATFRDLFRQRMRWYRGLVQNTLEYRHMIRPKYGYLGMFQMPLNIFFPFVTIVALGLQLYGIGTLLYDLFLHVAAVGFTLPGLFPDNLYMALLGFNVKVYFPLIAGTLTAFILIRLGYKHLQEDIKRPHALVLFFLIYYTLLGIFWSSAVLQEVTGRRERW